MYNHLVNKGSQYLSDITFRINVSDFVHIHRASYVDVDAPDNVISSYPFHNISCCCAIQALIKRTATDDKILRPLLYEQKVKPGSITCIHFAVSGLVKHKSQNSMWAVCLRLTQANKSQQIFRVRKEDKNDLNLVLLIRSTRIVATIHYVQVPANSTNTKS